MIIYSISLPKSDKQRDAELAEFRPHSPGEALRKRAGVTIGSPLHRQHNRITTSHRLTFVEFSYDGIFNLYDRLRRACQIVAVVSQRLD